MLPCIELTKTDGSVYSQPVNDIRHIFETPSWVEVIRITNRKSVRVSDSFDDIVDKANLDLVEFTDTVYNNRKTAVNRAYVSRVAKLGDGQAIIILKTEQSFYPAESFDTLSPLFEQVNGGGAGGTVTGDNVGTGEGVFKDKVGSILNFKSLTAGTGINLNATTNEIEIEATGSGSDIARATLTTADSFSVVVNYVGSLPTLSKVATGDYRLTVPTSTKIISLKITGRTTHLYGSELTFRILDTDGHYYSLAPVYWQRSTNQQVDFAVAGTIPSWSNTAADERTWVWVNMTFYGASGFEIVSTCI